MPPKVNKEYVIEVWERPYDPEDDLADGVRGNNVWRARTWPYGTFGSAITRQKAIRRAIRSAQRIRQSVRKFAPDAGRLNRIDWENVNDLLSPNSFTPDGSDTSPGVNWEIRRITSTL